MVGSSGGRSGGNTKKKLSDQYKDVCPSSKRKELDLLIKQLNGDEAKIMEKISEWWEDDKPEEPEWEDVSKKSKKKHQRNDRDRGGRGGRGRTGRGGGGGRGSGPGSGSGDRRARGRGRGEGRRQYHRQNQSNNQQQQPQNTQQQQQQQQQQQPPPPQTQSPTPIVQQTTQPEAGIPMPISSPPVVKGPWGQIAPTQPTQTPARILSTEKPEIEPIMGVVSPAVDTSPPPVRTSKPATPTGNVWATKGSAHLIQAEHHKKSTPPPPPPPPPQPQPQAQPAAPPQVQEKPKDPEPEPPAPPSPPPPAVTHVPVVTEDVTERLESSEPVEPTAPTLVTGLPSSVNCGGVNTSGWEAPTESIEPQLEAISSTIDVVKEPPPQPPKTEPTISKPPAPSNVLNMGHWETGDADETSNLDFGFGSFTDNDTPSVTETTMSSSTPADTGAKEAVVAAAAAATTVSPARPPPGLSITGVPPVPANAVLVSDLESKLESTSLAKPEPPVPPKPKPALTQTSPPVPPESTVTPILPQGGMSQNYNNAYGMGMYNYNAAAAGNGFVGMHGGPVLAGGVVPPKPQAAQANAGSAGAPQHLPPGGLYGAPSPAVGGTGATDAPGRSNDNNTASAAANSLPPGMPNAMYNPALFYGQQPYQMGQPHGGVGYGYGYGAQFGGVAQGGFGYQHMGQSGGYPSYDDQQQQNNSGGYNKSSSGGYRGRNSGNQYQNQYNPPGYGGQPYGMGYNVDHFGQRGGYGPGSMDPYGMQQGGGSYGQSGLHSFQNDDDHQKGKKGGRHNGSNLQQFQQPGQQQQQVVGQQQPFGLQGADTTSTSNAGWSNQAGGWGGPSWQQGN